MNFGEGPHAKNYKIFKPVSQFLTNFQGQSQCSKKLFNARFYLTVCLRCIRYCGPNKLYKEYIKLKNSLVRYIVFDKTDADYSFYRLSVLRCIFVVHSHRIIEFVMLIIHKLNITLKFIVIKYYYICP